MGQTKRPPVDESLLVLLDGSEMTTGSLVGQLRSRDGYSEATDVGSIARLADSGLIERHPDRAMYWQRTEAER